MVNALCDTLWDPLCYAGLDRLLCAFLDESQTTFAIFCQSDILVLLYRSVSTSI